MYEVYQRLLDEKGLKNADVARATGISNMTLSDWKRGKSVPKSDKMRKIAEYLGVSEHYLTTGEEDKIPNIKNESSHFELIMMFDELNEEQQKLVIEMMKNMKKEKE